jgi:hypothetical protein
MAAQTMSRIACEAVVHGVLQILEDLARQESGRSGRGLFSRPSQLERLRLGSSIKFPGFGRRIESRRIDRKRKITSLLAVDAERRTEGVVYLHDLGGVLI